MTTDKQCTVEEGKHVRACQWLEKATDDRGNKGRERGLRVFDYSIDGKPSRTFYAIKSKEFPNAMAINYCPFCGTQIDQPFKSDPR
ncbi:MAG: hypothetical protein EOO54_15380 [Haliea sp.]|nr:MAG: hypothetical protein EOO54_15380 [Haliea sp.]